MTALTTPGKKEDLKKDLGQPCQSNAASGLLYCRYHTDWSICLVTATWKREPRKTSFNDSYEE